MRGMILTATLAGLLSFAGSADAQVRYRHWPGTGGYDTHHDQHHRHGNEFDQRRQDERYHQELDRRERTRNFIERQAHRVPLTRWQDRLLHGWLDRERQEDAVEHDRYHHQQEQHQHYQNYGPYQNGYQPSTPQYYYKGYRR